MKKVRIKPYDKRAGHELRRVRVAEINGKLYEAGLWYDEPDDLAARLAQVNQNATITEDPVPGLGRAFDIFTPEEAEEVAELEYRAKIGMPSPKRGHRAPTREAPRQEPVQVAAEVEETETAKPAKARVGAKRQAAATG